VNYLAHLFLGGDEPLERLGGLIADFTRGRLETLAKQYPAKVLHGISVHRQVDRFTDINMTVARSRARFSPLRRRYAGIIVDILHDHYLSRHWKRYTDVSREVFIADAYQLLRDNRRHLPERMQRVAPMMIEQDWLGSYRRIAEIGLVYDRMSHRLRRPNTLTGAIEEVHANYQELEQDFNVFFPDVLAHANRINSHTKREEQ
jgi:acyl carrier protein phosphodiesterase